MRLSDVVSAASGLAIYAEIALVLFLAAFLVVLGQVVGRRRQGEWEHAASLALDDENDGTARLQPLSTRRRNTQNAVTRPEGLRRF